MNKIAENEFNEIEHSRRKFILGAAAMAGATLLGLTPAKALARGLIWNGKSWIEPKKIIKPKQYFLYDKDLYKLLEVRKDMEWYWNGCPFQYIFMQDMGNGWSGNNMNWTTSWNWNKLPNGFKTAATRNKHIAAAYTQFLTQDKNLYWSLRYSILNIKKEGGIINPLDTEPAFWYLYYLVGRDNLNFPTPKNRAMKAFSLGLAVYFTLWGKRSAQSDITGIDEEFYFMQIENYFLNSIFMCAYPNKSDKQIQQYVNQYQYYAKYITYDSDESGNQTIYTIPEGWKIANGIPWYKNGGGKVMGSFPDRRSAPAGQVIMLQEAFKEIKKQGFYTILLAVWASYELVNNYWYLSKKKKVTNKINMIFDLLVHPIQNINPLFVVRDQGQSL